MTFYEIFESLCKQRGISPTRAARDNGIKQQSVSSWKTRGSIPKFETIQVLSQYFNVPIETFFSKPSDLDEVVDHLLEDVRTAFPDDEGIKRTLAEIEQLRQNTKDAKIKEKERLEVAFDSLNATGRQEAVKRVEELTEIPRYRATRRQEPEEAPPAPPEGTDTPAAAGPAEGPPEGE